MPIRRRKTAADVEARKRDSGAIPHPVRRGERALVDVRILDLAADMEGEAGAKADPVDALQKLHRVRRCRAELARKLVGGGPLRLQAHEERDVGRVEIERMHDAQDFRDLVLVVERKHAHAERLRSASLMSDCALTGCM